MSPTVIRLLGATAPSAPRADAGTIHGIDKAEAVAPTNPLLVIESLFFA
jgi:hypothetical protein